MKSGLLASQVNYLEQTKAFVDQRYAKIDGGPGAGCARRMMLASISSQQAAYKGSHRRAHAHAKNSTQTSTGTLGARWWRCGQERRSATGAGSDGTVYRARTEKEAQQARALEAAYENMSNVLNEASRTRKATGAHGTPGQNLGSIRRTSPS